MGTGFCMEALPTDQTSRCHCTFSISWYIIERKTNLRLSHQCYIHVSDSSLHTLLAKACIYHNIYSLQSFLNSLTKVIYTFPHSPSLFNIQLQPASSHQILPSHLSTTLFSNTIIGTKYYSTSTSSLQ